MDQILKVSKEEWIEDVVLLCFFYHLCLTKEGNKCYIYHTDHQTDSSARLTNDFVKKKGIHEKKF